MRRLSVIKLLPALILCASAARAEEIPEHFTPIRPIGMGGAFTGVANDENAIWTNPAGISRSRKARSRQTFSVAKFPNLIGGANADSREFYKGFSGAQDKSIENILADAEDLADKPFWARAAIFPVMLLNIGRDSPMAFSLYSNTTAKAVIPSDEPEQAQVEAISDVGSVVTFAFSNDSNRFNFGVNVRPVARFAYEDRIPSEDLLNKDALQDRMKADANKSTGLGVDAGMMFTIADFWFPTFGVSILNLPLSCRKDYLNPFSEKRETVCGNVYKGSFGNEEALSTVDPTDIRVGISITPRLSKQMSLRFALDAHQIPLGTAEASYGLSGIEASKLVHAGLELFYGNPLKVSPFSLRAGYSQGFVTVGATVNLGFLELEFASYGRDISSTESPIEDRRILGAVSVDL